jgi:competence protein ComGF
MIAWNDVKRTAALALVAGLLLAIPLACPLAKLILQRSERGNTNERLAAAGGAPTHA